MTCKKQLRRSRTDRILAGVCGGIGEYTGIDSNIIRLLWIVFTFFGGIGLVLYVIAYFIIPLSNIQAEGDMGEKCSDSENTKQNLNATILIGGALIIFGIFILLDNLKIWPIFGWWYDFSSYALPAFLILSGIILLIKHNKKSVEPEVASAESDKEKTIIGKRIYLSKTGRKFLGVCAGIGEYLDVDPNIIRMLYAIFTVFSIGAGIVIYFLLYLLMPEKEIGQEEH